MKKLVIIAALKAAFVVAFLYVIILPHIHLLLLKISPIPSQDSIDRTVETTSNYHTAVDLWEDVETQVKSSPTYRLLEEYSKNLSTSLDHLHNSSTDLKRAQHDIQLRWERIQAAWKSRIESKFYHAQPKENNKITMAQMDFNQRLSDLVQSLSSQSEMNVTKIQASWNSTLDLFLQISQGLVDGTYLTRDLYHDFSRVDLQTILSRSDSVKSKMSSNSNDSSTYGSNNTDHVQMVEVWIAIDQIQDAFYQRVARHFSNLRYNKQTRHRNGDASSTSFKDKLLSQEDWQKIVQTTEYHLKQVVESSIREHSHTLMMKKLQEDKKLSQTIEWFLIDAQERYGRWKRLRDVLIKKFKHRSSVHSSVNLTHFDQQCCDREEINEMLDNVFLSLSKGEDVHEALIHSLERIKEKMGVDLDTTDLASSTPLTSIHERLSSQSKQSSWFDAFILALRPVVGKKLDHSKEHVPRLREYVNQHVDKLIMKTGILYRGVL